MKLLRYTRLLLMVSMICSFVGCKNGSNTSDKTHDSGEKAQSDMESKDSTVAATVRLDRDMLENIKIEEAREKAAPVLLTVTGKVQCNGDRMSRILAPVSGQVLNLRVKIGDTVRQGNVLFSINSRDITSTVSDYLTSLKDLDLAEKNYAMNKDLFEHQASSRISLQQAENDLAKAKVQVKREEESLKVFGVDVKDISTGANSLIQIRSPLAGTVIERHLTEGQYIQPDNNPLITVADLSTLWVLADVYERDIHLVKIGQKAKVTTAAYPDTNFVANVIYIDDLVDPVTRTVKVRFLVSDPKLRLKPEMFASVSIFLDESAHVLMVPERAVFTDGGQNFIYVNTGENEFSRRNVDVVTDGSGQLRVLSGLKAGEKVVSEGALLLCLQEDKTN